jgi:hypothetical protein
VAVVDPVLIVIVGLKRRVGDGEKGEAPLPARRRMAPVRARREFDGLDMMLDWKDIGCLLL